MTGSTQHQILNLPGGSFKTKEALFSQGEGYTGELIATGCCKSQTFAQVPKSSWTKS